MCRAQRSLGGFLTLGKEGGRIKRTDAKSRSVAGQCCAVYFVAGTEGSRRQMVAERTLRGPSLPWRKRRWRWLGEGGWRGRQRYISCERDGGRLLVVGRRTPCKHHVIGTTTKSRDVRPCEGRHQPWCHRG